MDADWQRYAVLAKPAEDLLKPLKLPEKILMSPGPSNCSERVLRSLRNQVLGHLHPEVLQLLDEIKLGIQYMFQTKNRLTLALSSAAHGGMEACLGNLLERGETLLIAKSGIWGERAADMADRIGVRVELLETECGTGFELEQLESALKRCRPAAVFVVHAETCSGVMQPLQGVGDLVHRYGALLIVDTVASIGGEPFFGDAWGVDAVYAGSQKVLGAPPGIAPISFSPLAEKKLFNRKTRVPSYYLDVKILADAWNCFGNDYCYHHTVSATLVYGLREALSQLASEGLPASWARHAMAASKFRNGLRTRGYRELVKSPKYQSSTVVAVELPPGVDGKLVTKHMVQRHNIDVAVGLGPTAGKVLRIGLMGVNATPKHVDLLLTALDDAFAHAQVAKL